MKKIIRAAATEDGLTLIEVLIALFVFAVGSLGALALTSFIFQTQMDSRNLGEATVVGRSELERILGQGATTSPALLTCTVRSLGTPNCFRELRATARDAVNAAAQDTGTVFQVENTRFLDTVTNMVRIEVRVSYPRAREPRGLFRAAAGAVDCPTTPQLCKSVLFYGSKANR